MLITCPYCGNRPHEEFTYRGDASVRRPATTGPQAMDEWFSYVYLRDNPNGRMHEYWHHSGGCRAWIVVERDTASHEISACMSAADWAARQGADPAGGAR